MSSEAIKAIARAKFRKDANLRRIAEAEGVSLEEAVAEYAAHLQQNMGDGNSASVEAGARNQSTRSETTEVPSGLPDAILRIMAEKGRPMKRMEIWTEVVRRGWVQDRSAASERHKIMGNALRRLKQRKKVTEIPGRKPRRVTLTEMLTGTVIQEKMNSQ